MKKNNVGKLTVTAIMSAVAAVLMFLEIGVPFAPTILKFDFSELPALLAGFALGPLSGVTVCFIKNLLHLFFSTSMGIGELSNFIIGVFYVFTASLFYKLKKDKKTAIIGAFSGAVVSAILSVFSNYFIIYPLYSKVLALSQEAILDMYKILPVENLWQALLIFNLPFTLVKWIIISTICIFIYKPLSPILKKSPR